jgi:hypothetical protein
VIWCELELMFANNFEVIRFAFPNWLRRRRTNVQTAKRLSNDRTHRQKPGPSKESKAEILGLFSELLVRQETKMLDAHRPYETYSLYKAAAASLAFEKIIWFGEMR